MDARCIDESPDADCLRACQAMLDTDPRAVIEGILRSALVLAGVDTDAARAAGGAPPTLLLRPTHALPESLCHTEWPLVFQHSIVAWDPVVWGTLARGRPWEYIVQFILKAEDPRFDTIHVIAHVFLNPPSATPWQVQTRVSTGRYRVRRTQREYASWKGVIDDIWDGATTAANMLPREALLRIVLRFFGEVCVRYDFGSGDLDSWTSTVSALFRSFSPSDMSIRVRTSDARHGVLMLEGINHVEELEAWAADAFAKAQRQTACTLSNKDLAMHCHVEFSLPYHLQAANMLPC
jgi:hypothetical protein